jgi:hypothetical protein
MSDIVTTVNETNVSSNAKISFRVRSNPKREGSKAHARFASYMKAKTVREYLDSDGTKADLKYDWEKGFIDIDGVERSESQ